MNILFSESFVRLRGNDRGGIRFPGWGYHCRHCYPPRMGGGVASFLTRTAGKRAGMYSRVTLSVCSRYSLVLPNTPIHSPLSPPTYDTHHTYLTIPPNLRHIFPCVCCHLVLLLLLSLCHYHSISPRYFLFLVRCHGAFRSSFSCIFSPCFRRYRTES